MQGVFIRLPRRNWSVIRAVFNSYRVYNFDLCSPRLEVALAEPAEFIELINKLNYAGKVHETFSLPTAHSSKSSIIQFNNFTLWACEYSTLPPSPLSQLSLSPRILYSIQVLAQRQLQAPNEAYLNSACQETLHKLCIKEVFLFSSPPPRSTPFLFLSPLQTHTRVCFAIQAVARRDLKRCVSTINVAQIFNELRLPSY